MGIEVVGVTKRFGPVTAVEEFSLRAAPGELVAIVGPSGCGKTTLLRVMAGLEQADAGHVLIGGREATYLPPERRSVGFVFQQFALFPNMNVAENIGYGLRQRRVALRGQDSHVTRGEREGRVARRERRVAELLTMIGMEDYAARRPAQLSSGQQQRVALARALAPEPRILLLDEPLSALDAAIRHQLRDELRRVQRRVGITTIIVTHDQEEALAIADRVAVMNEGSLEQVGSPWELYDRPRTMFVARFIGSGNFLTGVRRPDGIRLPGLGLWPSHAAATPKSASGAPGSVANDVGMQREAPSAADAPGSVTVLIRPESIFVEPTRLSATEGPGDTPTHLAQAVHLTDFALDPTHHSDHTPDRKPPTHPTHVFVLPAIVHDIVFGGERAHVHLRLITGNVGSGLTDGLEPGLVASVASRAVPHLQQRLGSTVEITIPYDALRIVPSP